MHSLGWRWQGGDYFALTIKKLTESALETELDSHLAEDVVPNRKNGKTSMTVKSTAGLFELDTPRDRAGTFEP